MLCQICIIFLMQLPALKITDTWCMQTMKVSDTWCMQTLKVSDTWCVQTLTVTDTWCMQALIYGFIAEPYWLYWKVGVSNYKSGFVLNKTDSPSMKKICNHIYLRLFWHKRLSINALKHMDITCTPHYMGRCSWLSAWS